MAFVAGTNLPTVDAGGHQRVFASSSDVAFAAGTNLPTVDAGSHQKQKGADHVHWDACPASDVRV